MVDEKRRDDSHPTMSAILDVVRALSALEKLGAKPSDPEEAKNRLEDIAITMGLNLLSLQKKVQRLDMIFHTHFTDIFKDFVSEDVSDALWQERFRSLNKPYSILLSIQENYLKLLTQGTEEAVVIEAITTPLLSIRFWPKILKEFHKKEPAAQVNLTTLEPYVILTDRNEKLASRDILLTYCSQDDFFHSVNSLFDADYVDIHRCLIAPKGEEWTLPFDEQELAKLNSPEAKHEYLANALASKRFAMLHDAPRVMPHFPWHKVEEKADILKRRSSQECVSCCLSGFAASIAHLELLDELEQKSLNIWELDHDFGQSIIAMIARKTEKPTSRKEQALATLKQLILEHFAKMKQRCKLAQDYSRFLSTLRYSYHTRHVDPKNHLYEWCSGILSVKVTPDLFVTGQVTIWKDDSHPYPSHHTTKTYPLFGRIVNVEENSASHVIQMGIRGMTDESEFFYATFLFMNRDNMLTWRHWGKDTKPCIIGHWIGGEAEGRAVTPNLGTWIWHSESNLEFKQVQRILEAFKKENEIALFPNDKQFNQRKIWGKSPS